MYFASIFIDIIKLQICSETIEYLDSNYILCRQPYYDDIVEYEKIRIHFVILTICVIISIKYR